MKVKRKKPKVAIIHDYLRTFGGGERVVLALHEIWPDAPIFVATADYQRLGVFADRFRKLDVRVSWAQKFFLFVKKPILYRPLLPFIWPTIDLKGYDIIISSSGSNIAKGIRVPPGTFHLCYCHTPPRFLYGFETETDFLNNFLVKFFTFPIYLMFRLYDKKTSESVDFFIANSVNVKSRIKRLYDKDALVIYPPYRMPEETRGKKSGSYYLVVSRLVRYKNVDLIVKAFNELGLPLKIIGSGNEEKKLKNLAYKNIHFLGSVSDRKLHKTYNACRALVVAASDEDYGITPVEAMSFGKPVIAYLSGGYKETVIEGKTGVFYKSLTARSLSLAVEKFEHMSFNSKIIRLHAERFSENRFKKEMNKVVSDAFENKKKK